MVYADKKTHGMGNFKKLFSLPWVCYTFWLI